jgi:ABC-type oligopeptide transport system substrate-binding subunit
MAKARRLAPLAFVLLLVGCGGSSAPEPPHGGATLRLASPLLPNTLDPAKVADLPSLNVAHELNAGLTRFSGRGVEPDLAESWDVSDGGLVWTFHLRRGRWSDDAPLTAEDFRRGWLGAGSATGSAYAGGDAEHPRAAFRVTARETSASRRLMTHARVTCSTRCRG